MAFNTDAPKQPYQYQRYPLVMHRGEWPHIESRQALNEEDEQAATASGWSTERPMVPEPPEVSAPLTLEERVALLEDKMAWIFEKAPPEVLSKLKKRGK